MGKKKPFIDRKSAQHFHVVHRSQRDPRANDPEASKYVLLSSSKPIEIDHDDEDEDDEVEFEENESESDDDMPGLVDEAEAEAKPARRSAMKTTSANADAKRQAFPTRRVRFDAFEAEDLVDADGMKRDGYDYAQHMKEMGHGRFYSATRNDFVGHNALATKVELPEDALPSEQEQERLLDAITLTTETMDADLRDALLDDRGGFETLDDDFVVQAAAQLDDKEENAADGFDYDAHIAKLMAAASGIPKYKGDLSDDEDDGDDEDEEEFDDEEEEEELDVDRTEQQRLLDEQFEQLMAEEYDDEQVGDLEDEEEATQGDVVLEGELLATIVDDLRVVQQRLLDEEGKVGNPLRTGNHLQEIIDECAKEREVEEEEGTADEEDPVESERIERELNDMFQRNAYLRPREHEKWDCETIVSTYSNLDNHPTVLREERVGRKKSKAKKAVETPAIDTSAPIVLSKKTGMPVGVFESKAKAAAQEESTPTISEELLLPTKVRGESQADKKARKEAVKALKQQRRQEKKQWKTAFKDEEQRQAAQTQGGKVSIFKYT